MNLLGPVTLQRDSGTLGANFVEEVVSFKLPANRLLKIWYMGGKGESADTMIRFRNITDQTNLRALVLQGNIGDLDGDGLTPLVIVKYPLDKLISFQAINQNLLNVFQVSGFGTVSVE